MRRGAAVCLALFWAWRAPAGVQHACSVRAGVGVPCTVMGWCICCIASRSCLTAARQALSTARPCRRMRAARDRRRLRAGTAASAPRAPVNVSACNQLPTLACAADEGLGVSRQGRVPAGSTNAGPPTKRQAPSAPRSLAALLLSPPATLTAHLLRRSPLCLKTPLWRCCCGAFAIDRRS